MVKKGTGLEGLIPLINELQSVFKTAGMREIKLPQIVVVGAQSSGKSSVLESLVKKSFLPRGTGLVTRCPIILQLTRVEKSKDSDQEPKEWCEFDMDSDRRRYEDFDEVRRAIEERQRVVAGNDKGISTIPVIVKVYSPSVVDLTLVDLPGIVKVPIPGQPANIVEQVETMIKEYISNESAIILAVSAANVDIATSESMKMAKEADPNGDRTLAVITKLDLMDRGTDAFDVLSGEVIQVKHGIIGVVNRSQEDLNNNVSLDSASGYEERYLNDKYPQIHQKGSTFLAQKLNQLLKEHINRNLPALIKRINNLMEKCENDLKTLGDPLPTEPKECALLVLEKASLFIEEFQAIVRERGTLNIANTTRFPAKIHKIFGKLPHDIATNRTKTLDTKTIEEELEKSVSIEGHASIEEVFKKLVRQRLDEMEAHCIDSAHSVHQLLSETAAKCSEESRLACLNRVLQDAISHLLREQLKTTVAGIKEHIRIQKGLIRSTDRTYVSLLNENPFRKEYQEEQEALQEGVELSPVKPSNSASAFPIMSINSSKLPAGFTKALIAKYVSVVKKELCDYIPKYLVYCLIDQTIEKFRETVKRDTDGKEESLMSESPDVSDRRLQQQTMLKNLQQAMEVIRRIRSTI